MGRQQGWFAVIIFLAIAALIACTRLDFQLGLDLRGGSQLTLEVQPTKEINNISKDQIEAVKSVLDRRVNGLGVADSTLQTIGTDQLLLELPGEQDPTSAARILGKTALLEFRAQKVGTETQYRELQIARSKIKPLLKLKSEDNNDVLLNEIFDNSDFKSLINKYNLNLSAENKLQKIQELDDQINRKLVSLFEPAGLTGKDLVTAGRRQEQNLSDWEVTLSFNKEGGEKFSQLTKSIAGSQRLLGIVLDGVSISEASVGPQFKVAGITGGAATISGNFSAEGARELEVQLRGGSLPLPVKIIQIRTIGATLGAQNIRSSLIAALSGLLIVAIFMLFVYRLAGLVSVIALCFYALFNLAIYAIIPVTLTLPGIAGFILSIGMAVDANVLIFERLKDELRKGKTLIRSIDASFSEAFSSIIDGHLTTLLSCVALFYLGTGFVKGFAATLGIGVLISLFTSLSCTKTILKFLMSYQGLRRPTNFIPRTKLPNNSLMPNNSTST